MISIEQHRKAGADVTIYFSCVPKGRFTMPYSLREMVERNPQSKVKLYHGEDLEIQVSQVLDWVCQGTLANKIRLN